MTSASAYPPSGGLVSVVIPAKDEADNLAILIEEILAALSGRPHEVVVVDDGSTDGTASLLAGMKAAGKPVRHVRHAVPAARAPPSVPASSRRPATWW